MCQAEFISDTMQKQNRTNNICCTTGLELHSLLSKCHIGVRASVFEGSGMLTLNPHLPCVTSCPRPHPSLGARFALGPQVFLERTVIFGL